MNDFLRGVLIGLTVAIPVGPMAILTIRKSLVGGWRSGSLFGTGIALADTTYALIAVGGFATVQSVLAANESLIRLIGGALLIVIGAMIARSGFAADFGQETDLPRPGSGHDIGAGYVLALSNPATILIFLALIAGYGASFEQSAKDIPILIAGVFAGSAGWWTGLSGVTALVRRRLPVLWIRRANLLAGIAIGFFGVAAIVSSL